MRPIGKLCQHSFAGLLRRGRAAGGVAETLTDLETRVFRYSFLLGTDWKRCDRQMKIDRGLFFHTVYRVEETLGRAFVETEPYALYPLDEYCGPPIRQGPFYRLPSRIR